MNLKEKMLAESLGYTGNKFQQNYYYSNLIKAYGNTIRDFGLFEAYTDLFCSGESMEVVRHLSKNIDEVLYLSASSSPLLLEGYANLNESIDYELNEGIGNWLLNVFSLGTANKIAKKIIQADPQKAKALASKNGLTAVLSKNKVLNPEQKKAITIAFNRGSVVEVNKLLKGYAQQNPKILKFKPNPNNSDGDDNNAPQRAASLKTEEFIRGLQKIINEDSFDDLKNGGYSKLKRDRDISNSNMAKEHGGYNTPVDPDKIYHPTKGSEMQSSERDFDSGDKKYDSGTSPVEGKDVPYNGDHPGVEAEAAAHGNGMDAGAMAAAAVMNKTVSTFLMGIPMIGPFIAPFAGVVVGLMGPLVLMALRRLLGGKRK